MDPFVLLLRCGGGDAVHHVVPFHYSPISLCFTRLNQLTTVVGDVQLKAVLLDDARTFRSTTIIPLLNYSVIQECKHTGFLGSSTSRMLRFSKGMIPRGSLSCWRNSQKLFCFSLPVFLVPLRGCKCLDTNMHSGICICVIRQGEVTLY